MSRTDRTSPVSQSDDGDAGHVDDREDFLAAVGGADAQVVHAGRPGGCLPCRLNVVVAQPVVAVRGAGGPGLGQGPVGLAGGGALHCPVRAVLVVVLAEGDRLALQVKPDGGSWRNQLANVACDRRGADASGSRRPAFTCSDDPASPAVHIC